MSTNSPLIAVDVGNSRIKLGWFDTIDRVEFPSPVSTFEQSAEWSDDAVAAWLPPGSKDAAWLLSSVAPRTCATLIDSLRRLLGERTQIRQLSFGELPLEIKVPRPDKVGLDRLMGAIAANRLRRKDRSAIIVDLGTAITVNRVDAGGAFVGGAILPGFQLAARSLSEGTQLLPEIAPLNSRPTAIGVDTVGAIQSGIYWGAVGAVGELVRQISAGEPFDLFLTGGSAELVADAILPLGGANAKLLPQLTLSGIAICASATPSLTRAAPLL